MPISCPDCSAEVPEAAAFCPACGCATPTVLRARGIVGRLPERLAGALAYFLLPAIVFLVVKPYRENPFVRFHSYQSLGFFAAGVVVAAALRLLGLVFFFIPVLGLLLLSFVVSLGFFVLWVLLIVKVLQGEMFELPMVGRLAAAQTSSD